MTVLMGAGCKGINNRQNDDKVAFETIMQGTFIIVFMVNIWGPWTRVEKSFGFLIGCLL